MTSQQSIETFDVSNTKGIIGLNLGKARLVTGYTKLIHIIELEDLKINLENINKNIKQLDNISNRVLPNYKIKIAYRKYDKLKKSLDNILPITRNRRGLINPLGSLIKSITGNLDNDDLIQIQNAVTKLENGDYKVVQLQNEQVRLNDIMIERFEQTTRHINLVTEQLNKIIDTNKKMTETILEANGLEEYFYRLDDNIQLLQEQINDIHEVITFAKINVISRHILDGEEMNYVKKHFNKNNINIASEEQIYSMLKLKAYYNHTNIILAVEIPQFYQEILTYYRIKPIPINNNEIIKTKTNTIILNSQNYMEINKPCPIIERTYYCQEEQIYNITHGCIPKLILNIDANCKTMEVEPHDEIDFLEGEYLYVSSEAGVKLTTNCNINNPVVKGKKLLNFKNCSVTINEQTYSNENKRKTHKIMIIQPFDGITLNTSMERFVSLPQLSQQTIKNIKMLEHHQTSTRIRDYSIATSTLILIATISTIIFYLYRKNKLSSSKIKETIKGFNQHIQVNVQTNDVEDDINLRREELHSPTHIPTKHTRRSSTPSIYS